jgi:exonuclease SbcC
VRLSRLHLVNFRQHADTLIEFDAGLTGVIGANGAGKTTILEGIAWALYGNPAARSTRETIRFSRAPVRAQVRVDLDFELGGHRYRVERGLTAADLYLDGAAEPIVTTVTGVTEFLQRRLGMSRGEFFNTYFTGQKELNVMAAMKPAERAQFLSRVLGYEKLRTAQELARDKRKLLTAEIQGLRGAMRDAEAIERAVADAVARVSETRDRLDAGTRRHAAARKMLDAIGPRWVHAQQQREQFLEILAEVRVAESETAGLERDAERLDAEIGEVDAARAELTDLAVALIPLADIANEFQRMQELSREEGRRETLTESARALDEELVRLRERFVRIDRAPQVEETVTLDLEQQRRVLEAAEGELEAKRTEWVRDRQEAETKRQSLRAQYLELREQRERLIAAGEEGACPTCQRPLGGHFRPVLDELDSQIQTVHVDGNYYKARLDQLEHMPQDITVLDERRRVLVSEVSTLERKLAKVQLAVQERVQLAREVELKEKRLIAVRADLGAIPSGYDAARHAALRLEVERLAPLNERAAGLSALIEREPRVRDDRARVAGALGDLQVRRRTLHARRDEFVMPESAFIALRTAHEDAVAAAQASEVALATAQSETTGALAALASAETARQALAEAQRTLEKLTSARRLHEELDRALTDLRTELNFQLRPELSEVASAFLAELTDGRFTELELDDDYNIVLLEDGIPKPVISGGEEDVAHLVLRLAISQMIAERAGQPFSLLILDEVFGSLDDTRRHGVVELLRGLQDRFEQVILITHIESVREGLDHALHVRYDEESGSSIVRSLDGESFGGDEVIGLNGAGSLLDAVIPFAEVPVADAPMEYVPSGGGPSVDAPSLDAHSDATGHAPPAD